MVKHRCDTPVDHLASAQTHVKPRLSDIEAKRTGVRIAGLSEAADNRMSQKFLVPPVYRDGEDRVNNDGYRVNGNQTPAQSLALLIVNEGEVEHRQNNHWIEQVHVEDHHLRNKWNSIFQASGKKIQAITGPGRVETSRPIVRDRV